jgi:ppGpp synthetase/RelA/SpoT-type nucleotidyltranferase
MTPPNDELRDLTLVDVAEALRILQNGSLAALEEVPPQVQRLLQGAEAVCEGVGCADTIPLVLVYLEQVGRLVDYATPLQDALQLIVRRAEILGVIGRYVECRFKSFTSSFAKWWPKHLHGESADFGAYLEGENDLLAARVVALTLGDVVRVARLILGSEQFGWDRADVRDFYHDAKDGRYRSWHLKARFRRPKKDAYVQCEVQLRTGLEDIVHEIDHHLTYKRPPGTSDQGWIIWKTLSDNEVADLSKTIYNIAVTLDRKRQMASILQSIGTPELRALCDTPRTHGNIEEHLRHFAHTKVLAANLSTGLAERQTEIEFDSKGFVGLVKQSFTNTEGFDWETGALDFSKAEIFNFDRLDSTDHLVLVTQGYKEEFDKLNQCKPHLLDLWLNLWRASSRAADERHSFHRGQRWFCPGSA